MTGDPLNLLDIENAKDLGIEWALKLGPDAFRAITNTRKAMERLKIQFWGWVILAGILGFILGFLLGNYEPPR